MNGKGPGGHSAAVLLEASRRIAAPGIWCHSIGSATTGLTAARNCWPK